MKKAILCIGNESKGDDCVGLEFGKFVEKNYKDWKVFFGNDTPEDKFFILQKFQPDFLLIVDASIDKNEISNAEFLEFENSQNLNEFIFTTHNIPLEFFVNFLNEIAQKTLFLAIFINPNNLNFGAKLSKNGKISLKIAIEKFKKLQNNLITKM